MSGGVYLLCGATSLLCAIMLLRGYRNSGVSLLFWSGLCFIGLTIDNVMLYVDQILIHDVTLYLARTLPGLIGLVLLIYGMVWDRD